MRSISLKRPKGIRKGQQIFNFLQFLKTHKGFDCGQSSRMGDPFFISDELWDEYYADYLKTLKQEMYTQEHTTEGR